MSFLSGQSNTDVFGPFVSRADVEQAVIGTMKDPPPGVNYPRIVYYLAEYERLHGLTARTLAVPPSDASYRGGVDHETWNQDQFPVLIVVVKPDGAPIALDTARTYAQWFTVEISATVPGQDEHEAKLRADAYGACVSLCVNQDASLGGLAQRTNWQGYPELQFPDDNMRGIVRSLSVFRTQVSPVMIGEQGPVTWPQDPYNDPGIYPTVETVNVTLQVDTLS